MFWFALAYPNEIALIMRQNKGSKLFGVTHFFISNKFLSN